MNLKNLKLIPKHIAFIMDGNRRWAREKGLPTLEGHRRAVDRANKVISAANDLGIKYLTFYLFSSENWYRSVEEVTGIMGLFESYVNSKSEYWLQKNIKIKFAGNLSKVPPRLLKIIEDLTKKAEKNTGMNVIMALSYGGSEEIAEAAKKIAMQYKEGECSLDEINEEFFKKFIYANVPDPDLLIRTGGDIRVSNFLLWQIAYTELYFIKKYWPDFTVQDLEEAIIELRNRERRYGR